jgi:predicted phage terminase large subunit-like protein
LALGAPSEADYKLQSALMMARLLKSKLQVEKCEEDFGTFVREAWKVVEPSTPLVEGKFLDAICEHLQALYNREIRKLIINIPPRFGKSSLCSVCFPAWIWLRDPGQKLIHSSFDLRLSHRDSRKTRTLIGSPWYQRNWADKFKIASGKGGKDGVVRFDNDKGGFRMATSIGAGTLGDGGDLLCLPGDEVVWTEYGKVPIRDLVELRAGCRVWSYNTQTQTPELKRVENWFHNPANEIVEVTLDDGSVLRCTGNHRVWTSNRGYVAAEALGASDILPSYARFNQVNCLLPHPEPLSDFGVVPRSSEDVQSCLGGEFGVAVPSTVGGLAESFSDSAPQDPITYGVDRSWAHTILQRQSGDFLFRQNNFDSLLRGEFGAGSFLAQRESPMADRVCDVVRTSAVLQIAEARVAPHSVLVSNFLPFRARPEEGESHNNVGEMHFTHPVSAEVSAGVALVGGHVQDGSAHAHHTPPAYNSPGLASETAQVRNTVHSFPPRDRSPVLIRKIGNVKETFCLGVADNHNFVAGLGHGFIISNCQDDANDVGKMATDSAAHAEAVINFYELVMGSRFNDPKTGISLVIQQRCAENDLTGHILSKEAGWDHLCLPMEYEGEKHTTSIGWQDWREEPGELLCPERFSEEFVAEKKKNPMVWAGQFQQRPAPAEGNKFKREWFNYYNEPSIALNSEGVHNSVAIRIPGQSPIFKTPVTRPVAFEQVLISVDCAFKDERDSDFVSLQAWGRVGANFYLLARDKKRRDFPSTVKAFREFVEKNPCPEKLIEDKANGPAVIATCRNEIPGIIPINPEGGKVARANAVSPYVESGNVYLPNPDHHPWVLELIEEAANFPFGAHDDDVDSMTQALRRLADSISQNALPEFRVTPREQEPNSACHIKSDEEMSQELQPFWRRWIAVQPAGAALWVCETPRGALRVYREIDITNLDAHETGRRLAEASLPDIQAYLRSVHSSARWNIDILMPKEAFTPIEPIGSYAELVEEGILTYELTTGTFEQRIAAKEALKHAKFATNMAEVEDAAFDRLRDLLRFKPVDFERIPFNREKMLLISRQGDINRFNEYLAATEGQTYGDWPRIKFATSVSGVISGIGTVKKGDDIVNPFVNALLVGICAPRSLMTQKAPWNPQNLRRVG